LYFKKKEDKLRSIILGEISLSDEDLKDYILCKEIYHCTPEELERQDAKTVEIHYFIYCLLNEKSYRDMERIKSQNKSKYGYK
jgi:hypothetical protein